MPKIRLSKEDNVSKIVDLAKTSLSKELQPLAEVFIRQFFYDVNWSEFDSLVSSDLSAMALSLWNLSYQRQPHQAKIRIFNPDLKKDGWESPHTIVEIITDDMPFLVNSLQSELNRLQVAVYLIVHLGGIKVNRDRDGNVIKMVSIQSNEDADLIEAPLYFEIERQQDPKIIKNLKTNLERILRDVKLAVNDLDKMKEAVQQSIREIKNVRLGLNDDDADESCQFLQWLLDGNFIFLGYCNYQLVKSNSRVTLQLLKKSGLGVLTNKPDEEVPIKTWQKTQSKQLLVFTKTNTISTVLRPLYTDSIEVKRFNPDGELIGFHRFIGLYGSKAYYSSIRDIPLLRKKVDDIVKKFGFPRQGHAVRSLLTILESIPRNDFIQVNVNDLYEIATGIYQMHERRLTRLFILKIPCERYVSCLVYLPRDNFNTNLRMRIMELLVKAFNGTASSFDVMLTESILARIHFVIRLDSQQPHSYDASKLEQQVITICYSWHDHFRDEINQRFADDDRKNEALIAKYFAAFPAGYCEDFSALLAIGDVQKIEMLSEQNQLEMSFYDLPRALSNTLQFKLFHLGQTIPLSEMLPVLENSGFSVIKEQSYRVTPKNGKEVWINDFLLVPNFDFSKEEQTDFSVIKSTYYEAFRKIWNGESENDGLNKLVFGAQLNWRQISMLRAYAKFLSQIRFPFSQKYIEQAFSNNPRVAKELVMLFEVRFNPLLVIKEKTNKLKELQHDIDQQLEFVESLDEDLVLRRFMALILATIRTNYYQDKPYLSFKFSCAEIPALPLPYPKYEIFVYAPDFEGVHLRMADVARGGIRWSDRREDFRTEILGLMKAQQVKNAVIVPYGAKGGFVLKKPMKNCSGEKRLQEAINCYQKFISGLLDITDNIVRDKVVHPEKTVCYDGDDPYLVVAADKGTAKFSNIANLVAKSYRFWLLDAFASGGSHGFDHKKIGITARGAWESVKYNFCELGLNPQTTDFTVVGIGDMNGDVFGNGMILSEHIKLVGAFNHAHIFLDPNPDVAVSFQERMRLFKLDHSTWEDYNPKLISSGGGVYRRSVKSIKLSTEVKELLQIKKEMLTPNELINALLKMPADLLWNGGIGTYVKASSETDNDVGDHGNDAVRVNADQLRFKVVSEGGNLGFTQLARVEFALHGGIINTDFIDNSGGVDCSDHEVNIKILLNGVVAAGDLSEKQRNQLLAKVTDEVAQHVVSNNYRQVRVVSLLASQSLTNLDALTDCIERWEHAGKINRQLEFLPTAKILSERKSLGIGLTRPEIAVLLAYSKLILKGEILYSGVINDPYFAKYLAKPFPKQLVKSFATQLNSHQLSREIISTQLSTELINNLGITFVQQITEETGATIDEVIRAYVVVCEIFEMERLLVDVDALDYRIATKLQKQLNSDLTTFICQTVRWFLRHQQVGQSIADTIKLFSSQIAYLQRGFVQLLGDQQGQYHNRVKELCEAGVPSKIANLIASFGWWYFLLNIIEIVNTSKIDLSETAKTYFEIANSLEMFWLYEKIESVPDANRWSLLTKNGLKNDLDRLQKLIVIRALKTNKPMKKQPGNWLQQHFDFCSRWRVILGEIRSTNLIEFSVLYVVVQELMNLVQMVV